MISQGEKIRFFILRTFGNFFVLVSLYGIVVTFGSVVIQELGYRYNRLRGVTFVVADQGRESFLSDSKLSQANLGLDDEVKSESLFAQIASAKKTQVLTPVDTDFGIVIPKIAANARVIANVDAADYDTYMVALKQGVAHAVGTGLPGVEADNRNIYLFAHSTDYPWNVGLYNAIFYLIKELEPGDEIDIFFDGKRHIYQVEEKKIVKPDEVAYITQPTSQEQLILQTCWPPGTTLERLIIIAKPKLVFKPTTTEVPSGFARLIN